MKTERRHELQTNELADSLAHWIEAAKPYSRAGAGGRGCAGRRWCFAWGYLSAQNVRRQCRGLERVFRRHDEPRSARTP